MANKNKSVEEFSLYAKVFFKAFLKNRKSFHTLAVGLNLLWEITKSRIVADNDLRIRNQ